MAVLFALLSVSGCAGVGVAAVIYYKSQYHEVASVDINAPSEKVYAAVINFVEGNPGIAILNRDDSAMLLDLRQNETNGSVKVTAVNSKFSKLTITPGITSETETSPLMAVLKICKEMKVKCKEAQ